MRAFLIALWVTMTMGFGERVQATPGPVMPSLVGWWRSDALCLELFANGDFELSITGSEPKIQVLGSASVAPNRSAVTLNVKRIWRARYVSRCRQTHETGHFIDSADELGVTFSKQGSVTLELRRLGDDQLAVCATSCATLKREQPALLGRWRRVGIENASGPEITWAKGEVVELNLDATNYMCHVWITSESVRRLARGSADSFALLLARRRRLAVQHPIYRWAGEGGGFWDCGEWGGRSQSRGFAGVYGSGTASWRGS